MFSSVRGLKVGVEASDGGTVTTVGPSMGGYAAALAGIERATGTLARLAETTLATGVSPETVVDLELARARLAASVGVVRALDENTGMLVSELT